MRLAQNASPHGPATTSGPATRRTCLLALAAGVALATASGMAEALAGSAEITDRVRRLLATASRGRSWTTGRGVKRWSLMIAGDRQGTLWEDVDPRTLQPGDFWEAGSGIRVEMIHNGRVVGMMWLDHDG